MNRVAALLTWPVKSLGGGRLHSEVGATEAGLDGDRRHAVADDLGRPLSARSAPGLLRWSASPGPSEPLVTGPDGRTWSWSEPGLAEALSADLGKAVRLVVEPSGCQDLERSVLVTTVASHRAVEAAYGARLELARWRTNLHLDLDVPALEEHGWEGRELHVGDVVLALLHPCKRCTIPTYAPGGLARQPELLRFFSTGPHAGPFGINARVVVPGVLQRGAPVTLQ